MALAAGLTAGSGSEDGTPESPPSEAAALRAVDRLTLRKQVGQLLVSSFDGTSVPAYMRHRLRAGETAGVILFAGNGGTPAVWSALTGEVQRAAGGDALVAVDQEGGAVRTLPFAGPGPGQPDQGAPANVARLARAAAGRLRGVGVNVNLAPVADVAVGSSVMGSRAFAGGPEAVAASARAAVAGYRSGRIAATAKHFPGLGAATVNTDDGPAAVTASRALLDRRELAPFIAAVDERVPLVMLSHALYPALDGRRIASQSAAVVGDLLRVRMGFRGVVVTDSLEAAAVLARSGIATAAERSVGAGADLILMTGSASWNDVFPRLLDRARRSPTFRQRVRRGAARVLALKRALGLRAPTPR
ncbi:MAG TPA: glycoside hydrolase family 3 N-terminal domain-containing protein [Thermoleophilaceae bacterium]|nr:glycoside hydrolase family 3 N-terminal domain-containing protein [Thermoleophilaceae bacterium]